MKLSDFCRLDGCEKLHNPGFSFIHLRYRYDHCCQEHMQQNLKKLGLVNGHKKENKRIDVV